jgi:hypothetical protein
VLSIHAPPRSFLVPCKSLVVGAFQLWKTSLVPVGHPLFLTDFHRIIISSLQILWLSFPHARTHNYLPQVPLLHFAMPYGLREHAFCFTKSLAAGLDYHAIIKRTEKLWNCVCVCVCVCSLGYFASFTLCDSPSPLLPNWYV